MRIRVLKSKVTIRSKKVGKGAQSPSEGAAPTLIFQMEQKTHEYSLQSELNVEKALAAEPEILQRVDPHLVADAVYEIMRREIRSDLARGERR